MATQIIHRLASYRFTYLVIALLAVASSLSGCIDEKPIDNKTGIVTGDLPVISLSYNLKEVSSLGNTLTVNEADGQFYITATLSEPMPDPVYFLFQFNSFDTTARKFNDFLIPARTEHQNPRQPADSLEVVFPAGATSVSFTYVTMINDNLYELDEMISFFVRPLSDVNINLPVHPSLGLPYVMFAIEESKSAPQIAIKTIEAGGKPISPVNNEITVTENQAINITLSSGSTSNVLNSIITFELIPYLGAIEGVDYGFPYAENKLLPEDTSSNFTLIAEEPRLDILIPIYSKPIKQEPIRLVFRLISATNGTTIGTFDALTINITDDGNNGFDLNDTGISTCYDANKIDIPLCDNNNFPFQDGETNVPMQFTKYSSVNEAPTPTPSTLIDQANGECVYDKTTGLLWEVIADKSATYTWYNNNPTSNGGFAGLEVQNGDSTIQVADTTQGHIDTLNAINYCGVGSDLSNQTGKWRLPKLNELLSIMNFETADSNPFFLDNTLFNIPELLGLYFLTGSPSAISIDDVWCVTFTKATKDSAKLCNKSSVDRPAIMVSTVEIIPQ